MPASRGKMVKLEQSPCHLASLPLLVPLSQVPSHRSQAAMAKTICTRKPPQVCTSCREFSLLSSSHSKALASHLSALLLFPEADLLALLVATGKISKLAIETSLCRTLGLLIDSVCFCFVSVFFCGTSFFFSNLHFWGFSQTIFGVCLRVF